MPISGIIPQAKSGLDTFNELMQQTQENQYRQALSRQAFANAKRAEVISNLLNQAFAGGGGGAGTTGTEGNAGGGGSMSGEPNPGVAMLYRLGILKPTPWDTSRIEQEKKSKEELNKNTLETSYGQLGLNASFNALDTIFKDKEYREFAGTPSSQLMTSAPGGFPLGTFLQKNLPSKFPSTAAKKLAAANTHMGNIVVGVAEKLKGPFKQLSSNLINSMKANPTDSIEVQEAKIRQLRLLSELADRQNELISQLSKTMNPTEAVVESTRQLMPEFQQIVSENISTGGGQPEAGTPAAPPAGAEQNYAPQNLSNQAASSGEGIANVTPPAQKPAGKGDDMVYLVVKSGKGTRKVKMKRVFAEAIKNGKLKYE